MTEEQQTRLNEARSDFAAWARLVVIETTLIRIESTACALKHLEETKKMIDAEISGQSEAA